MKEYSFLDKLVHRIALSSELVRDVTHQVERQLFLDLDNVVAGEHVFVSGLPRSGTTMFLNYLHSSGEYGSSAYDDMPFILAPNLWHVLTFMKRHNEPRERAHKDGVFIRSNSPEAFEEVFWKTYEGRENACKKFRDFVSLVLRKTHRARYLSKNNQNIRRLKTIRRAFPDSHIVVMFRDPCEQAFSLLKQHQFFNKLHQDDSFTGTYFNLIGHTEFGPYYKPMVSEDTFFKDSRTINHWLEQWLLVYQALAREEVSEERTLFISYESICTDTRFKEKLAKRLKTKPSADFLFKQPKSENLKKVDRLLKEKAVNLYNNLIKRAEKI